MGVSKGSWDEYKKLYGNGSDSGNTGNNGTGAGGSYTGYSETPDVKAAKENISTGNFGSTAGAGTFGDYLSWSAAQGNNTLGMTGDQMVGMTGVAGTDKGSKAPAGPTLADYQEAAADYDRLHNNGMSTSDLIDYYMGQDAGAYEQDLTDIEKGQAYLSSQYQSAADNKNSNYSQDVATRTSANLNTPENIVKYVYEEAEKNGWTRDQINDVLDSVTNAQKGDRDENGWDYRTLYDEYEAEQKANAELEEARNRNIAAGGNGVIDQDLQTEADELYKYLGTKGATSAGLQDAADKWAEEVGATDEQKRKMLEYVDIKNAANGLETNYAGGSSEEERTKTGAAELAGKAYDEMDDDEKDYWSAAFDWNTWKETYTKEYQQELQKKGLWSPETGYADKPGGGNYGEGLDKYIEQRYPFDPKAKLAYETMDRLQPTIDQKKEEPTPQQAAMQAVDSYLSVNNLTDDVSLWTSGGAGASPVADEQSAFDEFKEKYMAPVVNDIYQGIDENSSDAEIMYAGTDFSSNPFNSSNPRQAQDASTYETAALQAQTAGLTPGTPEYAEEVKRLFLEAKSRG